MTLTFELSPCKPFRQFTLTWCAMFHGNSSTKNVDDVIRYAKWVLTDNGLLAGRPAHTMPLAAYRWWWRHKHIKRQSACETSSCHDQSSVLPLSTELNRMQAQVSTKITAGPSKAMQCIPYTVNVTYVSLICDTVEHTCLFEMLTTGWV